MTSDRNAVIEPRHAAARPRTVGAILGALLCFGGCTDKSRAPADGSTSDAGTSEPSTSLIITAAPAETAAPDSSSGGPQAVPCGEAGGRICGEPGDRVATLSDMPSLAGCEVYRGTVWLSGESAGDLWPLSSLRVVEGVLAAGSLLETLDGLECLERVGTLHFVLASLRDISGLRNLVAVGDIEGRPDAMGSLFIGSAENLSSLEGLENVASARELNISGNPLLTSLEGLSGLERLDGGITIQENPLLEDLSGLDNLHDFDGDLWIYRSDNLRSLHGLEQIETIRYLYIVENPVLDDLDGLAGLQRVTSGIKLVDNPMLSPDEIEAFLARIEVEGEVILE